MKPRKTHENAYGRRTGRNRFLAVLLLLAGVIFGATAGFWFHAVRETFSEWCTLLSVGGGLLLLLITVLSAAAIIVLLILIFGASARETDTLRAVSFASKRVAEGDLDVSVPVKGSDEFAMLAEDFNNLASALRETEKEKNAFAASVVHDLRAPMASIAGFADNLLLGAISEEKKKHYLTVISEETKRLARMVSDMLELSRMLAGDRTLVTEAFDICEMARLVLISLEARIDGKRLEVVFDADSDSISVFADRDAIHRVLYNICDNAIKFAKTGGRFEIHLRQQASKVTVAVLNEGEGIAPQDIPHIFDRFYKCEEANRSGVGLGLFIAKEILDAHGQAIRVRSDFGCNCEFEFSLARSPLTGEGSL